jgi:hypothetical protein
MSKSTSGIIVYGLGTIIIWRFKKQCVVAQSTMQGEMIATGYGKVQIDWLRDLVSEIGIGRGITRSILNHGLDRVATLNSGNFRSDSRQLRLWYLSIYEPIAKVENEIKHVAGTEILADTLARGIRGVGLGEFVKKIGLG